MFTRLSTSQIVSQIVHHCANITISTNIPYAGWSRSHTPPYLPPFLRTHPHLITTRQEQHNIFPIRWLHVLKATIKLRSSNLRSRQMDAGFSGRWLRGHPLPPLSPPNLFRFSFSLHRFSSLPREFVIADGSKQNARIWRSRVQRLSGEGEEGLFRILSWRGGEGVGCLQLLGGLLG